MKSALLWSDKPAKTEDPDKYGPWVPNYFFCLAAIATAMARRRDRDVFVCYGFLPTACTTWRSVRMGTFYWLQLVAVWW